MTLYGALAGLLETVVGEHCTRVWLEAHELLDGECLRLGLSKGLGIGIVLGGSIVKVPQIIKIVRSKSTRGLSLLSIALETLGFAITTAYNLDQGFPFSTFGETLALVVQNLIIIYLMLRRDAAAVATAMVAVMLSMALIRLADHRQLAILQTLTIPISISSKIPQILNNAKLKSTGELAAFSVFNYLLGSAARLYTTAVETGDPIILSSYILGTALNAILAIQMLVYWNDKDDRRRM